MKANVWKGALTAVFAALAAYFGELLIPLAVLILAMLADYGTGMARAWITRTVSSKTGLKGIVKKTLYLALVAAGGAADFLMGHALARTGVTLPASGLAGLLVTVWLIINELISILENLSACGVPVPAFLVKLIARLKDAADKRGEE